MATIDISTSRNLLRNSGYAVSTNGTSSLIPITNTSGLPLSVTDTFTLTMWHKCTKLDNGYIWSQDKASSSFGPNFRLVARSDGKIGFYIRNDANSVIIDKASSKTCLKVGMWQHIALICTTTTANCYINGVDVNDAGNWNHGAAGTSTFDRTTFAAQVRATTLAYHAGVYNEICIIKRALTTTEIENIYIRRTYPSDAKTLYLPFLEGSGSSTADTSGNGNNATLTNCSWVENIYTRTSTPTRTPVTRTAI